MPSRNLTLVRIAAIAMLAFASQWGHAIQAGAKTAPLPIVIEGLGKGTVGLNGPWQFHPGDDSAWAAPDFDSSGWEQLTADRTWGEQGHATLTGYAWYRLSLSLTPAAGVPPRFSLLLPGVDDAYEIYWNGTLIGRNGRLEPRQVWYLSEPARSFELAPAGQEAAQRGVLAVRVWKAPLLSDDSGTAGGFREVPLIGSPEAIATEKAALEFEWLRSRQLVYGENLLCATVAFLSFLLWLRTPFRRVLFWMTGFAVTSPVQLLLLGAHMGWPYPLAMGVEQLVAAIRDISLWFLLLWLLRLHENRVLSRITRILACIYFVSSALDGVLVVLSWNPRWTGWIQTADAVLTFLSTLPGPFPLVLVVCALFKRKSLDSSRWLVAILTFLDEILIIFRDTIKQGRQFTGWRLALNIDAPLFTIHGSAVSVSELAGAFLLAAIIYAVYNSVREDQRRQEALEREKIELIRESDRIRHYAEHDGLTGLWNHRVIVERLSEELDRSQRHGTPLSVILVDVDHFKKINDSFGHPAGDLVLREIGAIFARLLRGKECEDCAGRYGGEEFLLILPGCAIEGAVLRAEEMRLAVQSACIRDGETELQVTASFGVVSVSSSHHDADAVIRAVDTALYQAKRSGRNCVIAEEMDIPREA